MRRLRTRNYACLIQRHWIKKQNRSGQRGQDIGVVVSVTGRTCAGNSRDISHLLTAVDTIKIAITALSTDSFAYSINTKL